MQPGNHPINSTQIVQRATVCLLAVAFAIGIVRFAMPGYEHDMEQSGFKIENTSSPLQKKTEKLPWLNQ